MSRKNVLMILAVLLLPCCLAFGDIVSYDYYNSSGSNPEDQGWTLVTGYTGTSPYVGGYDTSVWDGTSPADIEGWRVVDATSQTPGGYYFYNFTPTSQQISNMNNGWVAKWTFSMDSDLWGSDGTSSVSDYYTYQYANPSPMAVNQTYGGLLVETSTGFCCYLLARPDTNGNLTIYDQTNTHTLTSGGSNGGYDTVVTVTIVYDGTNMTMYHNGNSYTLTDYGARGVDRVVFGALSSPNKCSLVYQEVTVDYALEKENKIGFSYDYYSTSGTDPEDQGWTYNNDYTGTSYYMGGYDSDKWDGYSDPSADPDGWRVMDVSNDYLVNYSYEITSELSSCLNDGFTATWTFQMDSTLWGSDGLNTYTDYFIINRNYQQYAGILLETSTGFCCYLLARPDSNGNLTIYDQANTHTLTTGGSNTGYDFMTTVTITYDGTDMVMSHDGTDYALHIVPARGLDRALFGAMSTPNRGALAYQEFTIKANRCCYDPDPANCSSGIYTTPKQLSWTLPTPISTNDTQNDLKVDVFISEDPNMVNSVTQLIDYQNATSVSANLDDDTTYYWRVDVYDPNDGDVAVKTIGKVWEFTTATDYATNLYPADDAKGLSLDLRLSWDPGFDADSYNVYLSDNFYEVLSRIVTPVNTTDTFTFISSLDSDTTYYWMIDSMHGSTVYDVTPILEFSTYRDLQSDTWVATDALGRDLPGYDECGSERSNKTIGMFYFLWLNYPSWSVYDITELFSTDPYDPVWGARGYFHWWGEPEMGYYLSTDPYVLRKHASMLSDAGVDMVFFDVGNALVYTDVYMKLCEVWQQMRDEGHHTPQICFQTRASYVTTVQKLYDEFYSQNLYPDLWFYWQGKPLMLSRLDGLSNEVLDFFTIRDSWAWQSGYHKWTWLDHYPQRYGYDTDSSVVEQTSVCIAQHATSNIGRSFEATETWGGGTQPTYDEYKLTGTEDLGLYFDQQWSRALDLDPEILFITGWNEWIAQRFVCGQDTCQYFLGQLTSTGDSYFVDQFNQEYSRDAEPMKDGHTDNYYYQLIDGIRKYKGVSQPQVTDEPFNISIDGTFTDWDNISLKYYDTYNDTIHRDFAGWSGYYYTNSTGRNDIVESKVAFDAYQIYFYVETADDLTSYTDPNWMLLFINADQDPDTGWEGYDYVINRSRTSTTVSVEECLGGWSWQTIDNVPYSYTDNKLEIAVPRCDIMQSYREEIAFDFHWADNIQAEDDIIEFAISGDSAPNRRFNYRYTKSTPATYFDEDDNFEGWAMTHNLSNGEVSNGVLSCDIAGSDAYMINWTPFNVDSQVYTCIHIRMKNLSSSTVAQFYWTKSDSGIMDNNKHVDLTISANDTEFKDYVIDLSSHAYWDNTIKLLRLDPGNATSGSVEIDFIRLQDRAPTTGDSCE